MSQAADPGVPGGRAGNPEARVFSEYLRVLIADLIAAKTGERILVAEDTDLFVEGLLDSLDLAAVVAEVEATFEFELRSAKELSGLRTLGGLATALWKAANADH